jgi:glycine oxidase
MKIAVVGGGIMGSTTALELASRGAEVVLLERAVPGAEASSAAAGILGAQAEGHEAKALLSLLVRARDRYPAFVEELRERTGIDVGYRVSGVLRAGYGEDDRSALADEVAYQRGLGLRAELVDAQGARAIEPEMSDAVVCAAHYPDDAQVDPPLLLRALAAAIAQTRVEVRTGATVRSLRFEGDACRGVVLDDGPLAVDAVVLAAGSWSSLVSGVPIALPKVSPARGQIVLLDERPPRVRSIVFTGRGYVVPRGDGRVLCGSTLEFVGYRREVTAGGVAQVLASAMRAVPSLASAEFSRVWSSFRPHCERPLMGASGVPGLLLATGHHRNGILLAKVTAEAVADAALSA